MSQRTRTEVFLGPFDVDDLRAAASRLGWRVKEGGRRAPSIWLDGWLSLARVSGTARQRALAAALATERKAPVQLAIRTVVLEGGLEPAVRSSTVVREVDPQGTWRQIEPEWARDQEIEIEWDSERGPLTPRESPEVFSDYTGEVSPWPPGPPDLADGEERALSVEVPKEWIPSPEVHDGPPATARWSGGELVLEGSEMTYVRWRLAALELLEPTQAPDLGRWLGRALRRARLDAVPERDSEAWAAWEQIWLRLTARDRAQPGPSAHQLAAHKLRAGRWIFGPSELGLLRRVHPGRPPGHRPSEAEVRAWQRWGQILDQAGDELELEIL